MPPHRDLAAFDERAPTYDEGWLGRLHHEIAERTAALTLVEVPVSRRILDVGCGTGHLLRLLADRYPGAEELVGIDPAPSMVEMARTGSRDRRLRFEVGVAEHLPYSDETFDLVVSVTSFDHWSDQGAGLAECARVTRPGGSLVLVDQCSAWLVPTLLASRRGKARTKRRATRLVTEAGFRPVRWHDLYAVIIRAVVATKP